MYDLAGQIMIILIVMIWLWGWREEDASELKIPAVDIIILGGMILAGMMIFNLYRMLIWTITATTP